MFFEPDLQVVEKRRFALTHSYPSGTVRQFTQRVLINNPVRTIPVHADAGFDWKHESGETGCAATLVRCSGHGALAAPIEPRYSHSKYSALSLALASVSDTLTLHKGMEDVEAGKTGRQQARDSARLCPAVDQCDPEPEGDSSRGNSQIQ